MSFYPVHSFLTIALLLRLSPFLEIQTSDWLDDVIQSTAPYVTIKCKKRFLRDRGLTEIKFDLVFILTFIQLFAKKKILLGMFLCCSVY